GAISGVATQQAIADATGGIAYRNANEIVTAIRSAMSDQEITYTLGFYPDDKTLDGKPHDLNVKLVKKDKTEGAAARFRKKYLATRSDARLQTPAFPELVADPLNATAVTLAAIAHP